MTEYFEPWLMYKHPIVRQLAFSIASPNIIQSIPESLDIHHQFELHQDHFWSQHYFNYQSRLAELDENPQPLLDFLHTLKSTRLGLRFEYLFWFWLQDQQNSNYELIQHSIQMIQEKQTLGELDFLIKNHATQQIEHWEVALKYYLGETDLSLKHWYGLNRSDTLLRKLNHFSSKQFQFENVLDLKIDCKFAILKGQLFTPLSSLGHALPTWVNPQRRSGKWGYQIIPELYRLQRREWICPDLQQSSNQATWWCNGLYHHQTQHIFYMYRQAPFLATANLLCK